MQVYLVQLQINTVQFNFVLPVEASTRMESLVRFFKTRQICREEKNKKVEKYPTKRNTIKLVFYG